MHSWYKSVHIIYFYVFLNTFHCFINSLNVVITKEAFFFLLCNQLLSFSVQTKMTLEHSPHNKKSTYNLYHPPHMWSLRIHSPASTDSTAAGRVTLQHLLLKKSVCQWACLNFCSSRVDCKTISVTTYRENVLKAMTPTLPSGSVLFLQDSETAHSMPDLPWHRETDQCTPLNLEIKRILVAQDYYVLRKTRKMGRRKNTYQIHNKVWMAPSKPAWHTRVHIHTTSTTVSPSLSGPSPEH